MAFEAERARPVKTKLSPALLEAIAGPARRWTCVECGWIGISVEEICPTCKKTLEGAQRMRKYVIF
jgi:rubrerythrin